MTAAVRRPIGLVALAVTALSSAAVRAQIDFLPEEFSAIANDAGVDAPSISCIDIRITAAASPREEDALSRILIADVRRRCSMLFATVQQRDRFSHLAVCRGAVWLARRVWPANSSAQCQHGARGAADHLIRRRSE